MIIFNEGLPRSGKSHDAVKNHIVPAVAAGRAVVAYIEGLDPAKVAAVAGVPPETGADLITVLTREQVPTIWQHAKKDALMVIDEAQNFWPTQRQPLGPDLTKFVAEHGHEGIDLVLMGQDLRDVHTTWRRRVSQKVVFTKMEALGKPNKYFWVSYKASAAEKFAEVSSSSMMGEEYDPAIFECYKSHSEGTTNKSTYSDPRANLFGTAFFKRWLPLGILVIIGAIIYMVWLFKGGGLVKETTKAPAAAVAAVSGASSPAPGAPSLAANRPQGAPPKDWADRLFERLESARVVYFKADITRRGFWGRSDIFAVDSALVDVWLELPGSGVRHIVSLASLRKAGFQVSIDEAGHDRFVIVTYGNRTALIGEGLPQVGGGGILAGISK